VPEPGDFWEQPLEQRSKSLRIVLLVLVVLFVIAVITGVVLRDRLGPLFWIGFVVGIAWLGLMVAFWILGVRKPSNRPILDDDLAAIQKQVDDSEVLDQAQGANLLREIQRLRNENARLGAARRPTK